MSLSRCPACGASALPDSNYCDQCSEPLRSAQPVPAEPSKPEPPVKEDVPATGWVKVFWTQDPGELAFVHSFLKSHGIPTFEPDQFAERYSLWTNPFFRTFSLAVPARLAGRAKKLLEPHRQTQQPDKTVSGPKRVLALAILGFMIYTFLAGVLAHILAFR